MLCKSLPTVVESSFAFLELSESFFPQIFLICHWLNLQVGDPRIWRANCNSSFGKQKEGRLYWLIASKAQTRACCHHLENNFSISKQWLTKPVTQFFIHLFIHCSFILCTYISHGPTMYQRGGDGERGWARGPPSKGVRLRTCGPA